MDAYRQPKFSYFLFKSLLPTEGLEQVPLVEAKPFIYIAHLMTPFSPSHVTVFTNCEEVRLTLFGKEIGVKPAILESSPVPRVPVVLRMYSAMWMRGIKIRKTMVRSISLGLRAHL